MNRFLNWFNLAGVLALAVLCLLQWSANRRLNLEINRLERTRLEQADKLDAAAELSASQASDLAILRSNLTSLTHELNQTEANLAAAEHRLAQSDAERDQLKASLSNWVSAVASRDEQLGQVTSQLKTLLAERDEALKQFNDLAERHNQLVSEWNALQSRLAKLGSGQEKSP